ncbi:hypothetical protein [Macrococcoides caseolyticum]|uniref:hypothetical protein n=1 Tax=Macrococcoides caseolyticum TaxID=69966 RepID=UPI001F408F21|nr:hypothetical protein [Macrococcus caseolyticus]MCE4956243.1 hypothetical protein [Macrococcus caseolyticus]
MTNNRDNNKDTNRDIIYNSETDRNKTHVTHQADGDTYKDGRKVRDGEHHDKVVVEERDHTRHDHIEKTPKKKNPWAWLLPLLLLALLAVLLLSFCNNKDKDNKDNTDTETKTEEKATTEESTTEEATTEEASIKTFDLATITNFDLAS